MHMTGMVVGICPISVGMYKCRPSLTQAFYKPNLLFSPLSLTTDLAPDPLFAKPPSTLSTLSSTTSRRLTSNRARLRRDRRHLRAARRPPFPPPDLRRRRLRYPRRRISWACLRRRLLPSLPLLRRSSAAFNPL